MTVVDIVGGRSKREATDVIVNRTGGDANRPTETSGPDGNPDSSGSLVSLLGDGGQRVNGE